MSGRPVDVVERPTAESDRAIGNLHVALNGGVFALLLAALIYPYLLKSFHWAVGGDALSPAQGLVGAISLVLAFSVPLVGVATLIRLGRVAHPTHFELHARHLALIAVAAPPMFVFFGVGLGLLGSPVRDTTLWVAFWTVAFVCGVMADDRLTPSRREQVARWRVTHGAVAAVLSIYVIFHLGNHLTGLLGPAAHARVMEAGRIVYRSGAVEPVLVALLIGQVVIGVRLAWRWCQSTMDLHRSLQVASGAYIGAFVLTHLNSALISARAVRGIPTDWGWASGAPEGLVADAWNVRLLPHYAFGVFFLAPASVRGPPRGPACTRSLDTFHQPALVAGHRRLVVRRSRHHRSAVRSSILTRSRRAMPEWHWTRTGKDITWSTAT